MARGWESKGVESQIEDARARSRARDPRSGAERERDEKRASLELSRRRVVRELESTGSDVHRAALQRGLDHLDAELKKLDGDR